MILGISAFLCLLVLFFFKYFNFVSESFTAFLEIFTIQLNPITLKLFLPVGISFYTFQTLSYVIDVYRGKIPAEKHFGYYAAFVSFFPQLVAGPIERAADLMPQIKEEHTFDYDNAAYGLKLMAWGLFKKMVIADTLSKYVSAVYDAPPRKWLDFHSFLLLSSSRFRSTATSPDIRILQPERQGFWAFTYRRISKVPISHSQSRNSGAAGTFHCPPGFGITFIFLWEETAPERFVMH